MPRHLRPTLCLLLAGATGCASGPPRKAPGVPPSPATITKEEPGGDAFDTHEAALNRQLAADWGWRSDKDYQARFPLPDRTKWTRVRFSFIKHLVGFKYGDDNHALTVAFIVPYKKDDAHTSEQCVRRFEEEAFGEVQFYGGVVSELESVKGSWRGQELFMRKATGSIDVLFKHYDVSVAWTGYPAYPKSCLVYTAVVVWNGHEELARKVRDKWMVGFTHFHPMTEAEPFRH